MRFCVGLAAAAAALFVSPAIAQEDDDPVRWTQSPIIFLPGAADAVEQQFVEGEAVLTFPLRWAFSTRLTEDVVIEEDGETLTLEAGTLLPKVLIDDGTVAYCTRSRVAEAQEGPGFMGAMFGSMLNTLQDKVVCLQDTGKDFIFDRAIVLGDGPGIVDLGEVEPLAFEDLIAEPMGTDNDFASFTLERVGRTVVQIRLDVIQRGASRNFSTWQSGRYRVNRYSEIRFGEDYRGPLNLFGVRFEVVDAERRENRAILRVTPPANEDDFVLVPNEITTTYGW